MAILEIKNISIEFPGVKALDNVSFSVEKGQVMALCGENGAGKSTLAKIIAGVHRHSNYSGEVFLNGEELKNHTTLDAEKKGISIVHQELNTFYDMTVAENIFMGDMPAKAGLVDYKELFRKAKQFLDEVGLDIDPKIKMRKLTVARMQMVEIAKAIARKPKVLIFDEATSSLTDNEIKVLFDIIKKLKKDGVTMIYVSHKLSEVFDICDAVTVLKDGAYVNQDKIDGLCRDDIIRWMVGRELKDMYPEKTFCPDKEEVFKVENWNVYDPNIPDKKIIDNVSFNLYKGEILGIYGLVGAGRTELVNSIFEGNVIKSSGELWFENRPIKIRSTADSIKYKISMATEDRKKTGLILTMNVKQNISIASIRDVCRKIFRPVKVIDKKEENKKVMEMVDRLSVKVPDISFNIAKLSGGNQQKVVLSKWLLTNPRILILDEPTRGIDVGTKAEIYKILRKLATQGMSIIMISSELPEILGVTDRMIVMREGKITGIKEASEANEEILIRHAIGGVCNE